MDDRLHFGQRNGRALGDDAALVVGEGHLYMAHRRQDMPAHVIPRRREPFEPHLLDRRLVAAVQDSQHLLLGGYRRSLHGRNRRPPLVDYGRYGDRIAGRKAVAGIDVVPEIGRAFARQPLVGSIGSVGRSVAGDRHARHPQRLILRNLVDKSLQIVQLPRISGQSRRELRHIDLITHRIVGVAVGVLFHQILAHQIGTVDIGRQQNGIGLRTRCRSPASLLGIGRSAYRKGTYESGKDPFHVINDL